MIYIGALKTQKALDPSHTPVSALQLLSSEAVTSSWQKPGSAPDFIDIVNQ